jgi:hypothetical protein
MCLARHHAGSLAQKALKDGASHVLVTMGYFSSFAEECPAGFGGWRWPIVLVRAGTLFKIFRATVSARCLLYSPNSKLVDAGFLDLV